MQLNEYLNERKSWVEKWLKDWVKKESGKAPIVYKSMDYSLNAGGKRLRPILLMAAAETQGKEGRDFLPSACALEMIHTYSLIHDDLPGMDDDDYRRGMPTNHKVFGVGQAILAGDGLLTLAFEVLASQKGVEPARLLWAIQEFAQAAGPSGMVYGQALDLEAEGKKISADEMRIIHGAKTGELFRAALRSGVYLAGGDDKSLEIISNYANSFGLAFQITDDILDVTGTLEELGKKPGSDVSHEKSTYVSIYSLKEAERLAKEQVEIAVLSANYFGEAGGILTDLALSLINRRK